MNSMNIPTVGVWPEPFQSSIKVIDQVFEEGRTALVSFSGGKDSSVLASLTLEAARRRVATGRACPAIHVLSSDTGVENPEVHRACMQAHADMRAFAKHHGIRLHTHVASPKLLSTWAVRIIGGRALPAFANSNRDCTTEWKVEPLKAKQREIIESIAAEGQPEPVVLTGTRLDESAERAVNMISRGEHECRIRRNKDGQLYLSPIAHLATDDVFEFLGLAASSLVSTYSDFETVKEIYASAGGSECAYVAAMNTDHVKKSRPCGARTGCWACLVAGETDKSLDSMVSTDDRYAYLKPLVDLRNFLFRTRYDTSRRNWVQRTVDDRGFIKLGPDTYSSGMLEELLCYALTIDAQERSAAARLGIPARFQILDLQQVIAIDFMWSLRGLHRPFHALSILREIEAGARYAIPQVETAPRASMPATRKLFVGQAWLDTEIFGLRDPLQEHLGADCGIASYTTSAGATLTDYGVAEGFEVDLEGAALFMDFEADEKIEEYHDDLRYGPGAAWTTYLSFGVVSLSPIGRAACDKMARRANQLFTMGYAPMQVGTGECLYATAELEDAVDADLRAARKQERRMKKAAKTATAKLIKGLMSATDLAPVASEITGSAEDHLPPAAANGQVVLFPVAAAAAALRPLTAKAPAKPRSLTRVPQLPVIADLFGAMAA